MPTLRMSRPFGAIPFNNSNQIAGTWTWSSSNNPSAASVIGNTNNSSGGWVLLVIYKGTPETFPSWTSKTTRNADILITFSLPTSNFVDYTSASTTHVRQQVGRHLTNQSASASGQASWFLLHRNSGTDLTAVGAIIGTVGISGTGADLEIPDINIVAGQNYRCNGFYMNFPLTYTW